MQTKSTGVFLCGKVKNKKFRKRIRFCFAFETERIFLRRRRSASTTQFQNHLEAPLLKNVDDGLAFF